MLEKLKQTLLALLVESPRRKIIFIGLAALVFAVSHIGIPVQTFPDTQTYVYLHKHQNEPGVWQQFMLMRPPLYPLIYWLVPNQTLLTILQSVVSFAAWCVLALYMSRVFSLPQIRSAVFYATVWGALGANILFWNRMILTESFSLSMLCLFIAGWLLAIQQRRYFLLFAAGLALLFLRDTMVYLVVPFSATVFIWRRDVRLVAVLCLLALASFQAASWAHEGERYVSPLINSVAQRIVTDPDTTAFFAARGLPVSTELLACAGKFDCPVSKEVTQWAADKGKPAYMEWIVRTLPARLIAMFGGRQKISPGNVYRAYKEGPRNIIYVIASLPPLPTPRFSAETIVLFCLIIGLRVRQCRTRLDIITEQEFLWLTLGAAAFGNLFISFWGDAMETKRHCLSAMVMVHLAILGLLASLAEYKLKASSGFKVSTHQG